MAIHSSFLGSVKVSGDDAKALVCKITHARGTKAASASATNGKRLVTTFTKKGSVTVKVPNATTRKAMAELEADKGKRFANVDDFMADLLADD